MNIIKIPRDKIDQSAGVLIKCLETGCLGAPVLLYPNPNYDHGTQVNG